MRHFLQRALILLALLCGANANAQEFPTRPVRLVVPLPAGGPSDALARAVAQRLSDRLQQPVVVDNKPGADGLIAAREVMGASADGYTLLFAIASMVAVPLRTQPPAFDWSKELAPVGRLGRVAFCVMVHPDVPVRTMQELAAYARAHPDKLNFASSTQSELMAASQFMQVSGVRLTRVPYKGGMQAVPDLLAGRVQVLFGPVSLALPHVSGGKLRVLATLLPARSPLLPDVPTIAEAGFAGVDVPTWQAVFAPARVPRAITDRLAADLDGALADSALRAEMERRSIVIESATPAQLAKSVAAEQAQWSRLIVEYKLNAE
jgi:tripartite-type tricarboxylate transporter receptor subunit TctC